MCYRKSFADGPADQINEGRCPSCGLPVAASVGITSGKCPHCGTPITVDNVAPINITDFGTKPTRM